MKEKKQKKEPLYIITDHFSQDGKKLETIIEQDCYKKAISSL